jgi:site-specific recombinase XerD
MHRPLEELVEEFCTYQGKVSGKTEGGVRAYRWMLQQYLKFVQMAEGRPATVDDLTPARVRAWMASMATQDLALSTMRVRQSTLSSFCLWLVKRDLLATNPVEKLDRPKLQRTSPPGVPEAMLMDALVDAVVKRGRPRDIGMFLILRYTGMRRESVATLKVKHLDRTGWLRGVLVKGGTTRDIPVPASVIAYLTTYTKEVLPSIAGYVTPETPLFWSKWGRRVVGRTMQPMTGKNLWRLTKYYGRAIGVPELKPHDLRHGVAMEMYGEHGDLEKVRALLGHQRIDTTQIYASIRPTQLKRSVEFLEAKASRMLSVETKTAQRV